MILKLKVLGCKTQLTKTTIMDDFEDYAVNMDGECLFQDFDDVDLYGEKLEDDSTDDFGNDIELN